MFRFTVVLLFTSLDKCFGDGLFCSDNVTWIFLGYIGVGALLLDIYEWSSRVGLSLVQRNERWGTIKKWTNDKLIFIKVTQ